jgi:hypothetical protein
MSVSRIYSINNGMINEYGAAGGMRIGREAIVLRENPLHGHSVHKSYTRFVR